MREIEIQIEYGKYNEMADGFAIMEMIFDENGDPVDYTIIDSNNKFWTLLKKTPSQTQNISVRSAFSSYEELQKINKIWIPFFDRALKDQYPHRITHTESINKMPVDFEIFVNPIDEKRFTLIFYDNSSLKKNQKKDEIFNDIIHLLYYDFENNDIIKLLLQKIHSYIPDSSVAIRFRGTNYLDPSPRYPFYIGFDDNFSKELTFHCPPHNNAICDVVLNYEMRKTEIKDEQFKKMITDNKSIYCKNLAESIPTCPSIANCDCAYRSGKRFGYKSFLNIPLQTKNNVFGFLVCADHRVDAFNNFDINFLETTANTIAIGLRFRKHITDVTQMNETYRKLIQTTQTAFIVADEKLLITQCNDVFESMVGRKVPVGTPIFSLIHEEDRPKLRIINEDSLNKIEEAEVRLTPNKSKNIWVQIHHATFVNGENKFFFLIRDINEKKEKELERSRELEEKIKQFRESLK